MKNNQLVIQKVIHAPIERVWKAWTNPDDLKHWFTAETGITTEVIQFDVKVGGKVRLKFPGAAGEYTWTFVKIDKPSLLVVDILDFSFAEYPEGNGGICNVGFKDLDGKTQVTISGELLGDWDESMEKMAQKGWGGTLDRLNNYLKEN
jgi:uncharacterized protein YndB with AHSA1/START domain